MFSVPRMFTSFEVMGSLTERGTEGSAPLMQDEIHALHGVANDVETPQIALEERKILVAEHTQNVVPFAGRKVVQNPNLFATGKEASERC